MSNFQTDLKYCWTKKEPPKFHLHLIAPYAFYFHRTVTSYISIDSLFSQLANALSFIILGDHRKSRAEFPLPNLLIKRSLDKKTQGHEKLLKYIILRKINYFLYMWEIGKSRKVFLFLFFGMSLDPKKIPVRYIIVLETQSYLKN